METKNYIYLSYYLNEDTPLYGGNKGIIINKLSEIKNGDSSNTKELIFNNHSGTHIDFPNHFIDNGKVSNDYDPDFWFFNNPYLIKYNAEENEIIDLNDSMLLSIPTNVDFLIIKTNFYKVRNQTKYWKYNPGISPNLATKLRTKFSKLRAIGFDFISLTSYQNRILGRKSHKEFLGKNEILIVEDMDLSLLKNQPKKIMCFPLQVKNIDGAPVNVIAEL